MLNNKNFLEKRFITGFSKTSSGNMAIAKDPLSPSFSLNIHGSYSQKTTQGNQLLPYPYTQSTTTTAGITYTDNGDGSITINGTATGNAYLNLYGSTQSQVEIPGNYISGGANDIHINVVNLTDGNYTVIGHSTGGFGEINKDTYNTGYVQIVVYEGATIDNVTIYPMLSNEQNINWEPYTGGEKSPNPNYPSEPTMLGETSVSSNLYNFRDVNTYYNNALGEDVTVDDDGWITIEVDNSTSDTEKFNNFWTHGSPDLKTSTQYSVIMEVKEVSGGGYIAPVSSNTSGSQSQFSTGATYGLDTLSNDTIKIVNDTTLGSFVEPLTQITMLRTFLETPAHSTNKIIFRLSVIEDTSITPDNFIYEPYANIILRQSNKNLLPNNATTQTINGVTFTKNSDGSVTANGTATGDHARYIIGRFNFNSNVDYFMSGCPINGSNSTYRMDAFLAADGNVSGGLSEDFGNGVNIKLPEDAYRDIRIIVFNGATVDNLTFYPMINLGTTISDYVPHQGNNYYINLNNNLVEATSNSCYDRLNIDLLGNCKLIKNIDKTVFNNNTSFFENTAWSEAAPNYFHAYTYMNEREPFTDLIMDKFLEIEPLNLNKEGFFLDSTGKAVYLFVKSSRLSSFDIAGFKQWLANNYVGVWYQLDNVAELLLPNLDKPITLFEGENIFTAGSNLPTTLDITYQSRAN